MSSLVDMLLPYNTINIIGMTKNAGKTTVLNHLIRDFGRRGVGLALTSIGRDGEEIDVVTQTSKPRIFVAAGTIVITTEKLLPVCDITKEIVAVTDFATPLGRVVVVRAISGGFVQLGGPSITTQMAVLVADLQGLWAEKIIIDGAISRKSLASPTLTQATVLCTGAALAADANSIIDQTCHAVNMLMLPKAPKDDGDHIYLPGAVSDARMRELVLSRDIKGRCVIADDASKVFISSDTYSKLLTRKGTLAVRAPINLVAVAVNPVSPRGFVLDAEEFLAKMRAAMPIPVYDVAQKECLI
ncbi:MAG: hypothetical protein FWC93_03605 [Defluviitaleaceae bacterium]|nr:hypothetical protein [Defluviitaleaceae bacterium]